MARFRELAVGDRVRIKRRAHPHSGEYGKLVDWYSGIEMWEVDLENCPDWIEGCFAASSSLELSREPAPPGMRGGS